MAAFQNSTTALPSTALTLNLPARQRVLDVASAGDIFLASYDDIETLLALHRFAWVPLAGEKIDPAWVGLLWKVWLEQFGIPGDPWAWHPYTAAERAINILTFAARHGLPGDPKQTLACLATHAPAIATRLEYFGEANTSNHLSNNGRGLFLLGLTLGLEKATDLGEAILLAEAERLILPSGMVREGSSHYHLLVTRNYLECWLAARKHGRSCSEALRAIAGKLLAVGPVFDLPGGPALIGDISPDCPPDYLTCLLSGDHTGWLAGLDDADRMAFIDLYKKTRRVPTETEHDGWLAARFGDWQGLWYAAPGGWSHMPGHGHQDLGGFELYHMGEVLFIDPGRGAYGETGEAALYRSAHMHNGVIVDDADPYPPNRPYYDERFRRKFGGPSPKLLKTPAGIDLHHHGFSRLRGVAGHTRSWQFADGRLVLADRVEGSGCHFLTRTLITPLGAVRTADGIDLTGAHRYRLSWDGPDVQAEITSVTGWSAYGIGSPVTAIRLTGRVKFPVSAKIVVERVNPPC